MVVERKFKEPAYTGQILVAKTKIIAEKLRWSREWISTHQVSRSRSETKPRAASAEPVVCIWISGSICKTNTDAVSRRLLLSFCYRNKPRPARENRRRPF